MTEKMKAFENACRVYFSSLSVVDLRNYGRLVGVARPTAKKKEELVQEIIEILLGLRISIPVSKQGAPVKNDRVDERILVHVEYLKREYFTNDIIMELPKYDFHKEYQKMLDEMPVMRVADPTEEKRGFVSKTVTRGQVERIDGEYCVYPLDCPAVAERVLLPEELVKLKELREGDIISCYTRQSPQGERSVAEVATVNDIWTEEPPERPNFEDCFVLERSTERINVYREDNEDATALKYIDWFMPIAKGQRGCVVSAPKAGKSRLLAQIAEGATKLNSKMEVFVLLVEQAPEAIREYQRFIEEKNLFYTTYEDDAERQVFTADFLLKRIKRKVENKKDVLLIVDSFTALAHAFNDTDASAGGKTLACGLELKTVRYLKKFFGAARSLEQGGSLTILGGVSQATGNPFDDVVCAECVAQANYEICLDNDLAMRRIYPAIDFHKSNSKQSEYVLTEKEEECNFLLRNDILPREGADAFLKRLSEAKTVKDLQF